MDESIVSRLRALSEELDGLGDEVENALEEHATFREQLEVRRKLDETAQRYQQLMGELGDDDRAQVERTHGRRVTDLYKMASRLPAPPVGRPAEAPADTSFFGTRAGKSSRQPFVPGLQPGERPREPGKVRVTDEIDAWCGRCGMVRAQTVAAVVDGQPAQVICATCGSRARYREGPARKSRESSETRPLRPTPSAGQRAADAKMKERNELLAQLQSAENVRKFDPKERYRVGEIIEHPEHGRGKIENTLPRSLLVRFAGGLKPVKLG